MERTPALSIRGILGYIYVALGYVSKFIIVVFAIECVVCLKWLKVKVIADG